MTLLPNAACGNDPQPDDCGILFRTAELILSAAWRALVPFAPTEPNCAGITTYVSLGEPPADCCDLLAIWLTDYGPTAKASALDARSAMDGGWPVSEANWTVALWESCYPTVDSVNERPVFPDPAELHEVNRAIYNHGLAMYAGVIQEYLSGTIWLEARRCPRLSFGKLRPLVPNGGCAGWTFTVVGDLDDADLSVSST